MVCLQEVPQAEPQVRKGRRRVHLCCGVIRHGERADDNWCSGDGVWTLSEDFRRFPVDPPLSDVGMQQTGEIASVVRAFVDEGEEFHSIVCSPYFRCLQTAVGICLELGPQCHILVDYSLGETFGPPLMGQDGPPASVVRPMSDAVAYCQSRGVRCNPVALGQWPTWPEYTRAARRRFANAFLGYVASCAEAQQNFLVVAHADCVAAALAIMPPQGGRVAQRVDYGGMFLAKRKVDVPQEQQALSAWRLQLHGMVTRRCGETTRKVANMQPSPLAPLALSDEMLEALEQLPDAPFHKAVADGEDGADETAVPVILRKTISNATRSLSSGSSLSFDGVQLSSAFSQTSQDGLSPEFSRLQTNSSFCRENSMTINETPATSSTDTRDVGVATVHLNDSARPAKQRDLKLRIGTSDLLCRRRIVRRSLVSASSSTETSI
eukprot:TRINITY_DN43427_c0_g1_i1.p1 TRINITY_DN43427_c0_g1~~TRINITY_DN43427_c0_g1_i1.p1  ORF type:complete len:436 (-),score=58.95 TRINITY_DN43427_c0_g1_i1:97-1404(-)